MMGPLAPSVSLLLHLFLAILCLLGSLAFQWACIKLQALKQWAGWPRQVGKPQLRVLGNEGKC